MNGQFLIMVLEKSVLILLLMKVIGLIKEKPLSMGKEYIQLLKLNEGTSYKVVFQNRVNTVGLQKHNHGPCWLCWTIPPDKRDIWLTPNEKDIRPYGLCIKEVPLQL